MIEGACLCGTVRWSHPGELARVVNCHCAICRKHHGTSWATYAVGPREGFRWESGAEAIRHYATSARVTRAFCAHCGAKVPMLTESPALALMPAGALHAGFDRAPDLNLFAASRTPWTRLDPAIPAFDAYPPGVDREPCATEPEGLPEGVAGGRCLCGTVAWQVDAAPLRMYHCHCLRCRKARGTGFATNVFYPVDAFRWRRGEDHVQRYALPGARFFGTAFCRTCGSAAPRPQKDRGVAGVAAGSLDVDPGIRPSAHIYAGSKAPWDRILDDLPQHDEMPPG